MLKFPEFSVSVHIYYAGQNSVGSKQSGLCGVANGLPDANRGHREFESKLHVLNLYVNVVAVSDINPAKICAGPGAREPFMAR